MSANRKDFNSYLVMCIEEYAFSAKQKNFDVYRDFKEKGIIEILKSTFDASFRYIKFDLIDIIRKAYERSNPDELTVLSRILVVSKVIEEMVKKYHYNFEKACDEVYETRLIQLINDKESGLLEESVFYIVGIYDECIKNKK